MCDVREYRQTYLVGCLCLCGHISVELDSLKGGLVWWQALNLEQSLMHFYSVIHVMFGRWFSVHADIRCLFLPVNKSSVYMESLSSTTNPKPTCRYRQILVHVDR